VLLTLLVAVYVVVGFAGELNCASEALEATSVSNPISVALNDGGSKKSPTLVDHCYTCVPLTIPAAPQISEPLSHSVALLFPSDTMVVLEERLPDTPPPKFLI
jgi:hypothetical protein